MREAMLYEKLRGQQVRCHVCQWRCVINPGKSGVCRVRHNYEGTLQVLNYARVSSVAVDPIEKKPLFHFFPGSRVLSFGTVGCNFHCEHCQNWEIACVDDPEAFDGRLRQISPQEAIGMAVSGNCEGIAWTYNEPVIWFEYTLDSARLAKEKGLYTVYVTNGFITPEALDTIGPYLDAWRVDVKGFSDKLYRELARISNWRSILEMAERAQNKWKMHVEVVTNVIPTMNDDDAQLQGIAGWIGNKLGELTPWHVTRFYPNRNLMHLPPTPISTLEKAYDIGKKSGLRFVYLGNVSGHAYENTVCYNCSSVVIKRSGYRTNVIAVKGSKCAICGAELNIRAMVNKGAVK